MRYPPRARPFLIVALAALLLAGGARAVIMVLTPLKQVIEKEQFLFVATVQQVLPDKPAMVLTRAEELKGKFPFERLPVNLTGDSDAAKDKHTPVLLDRIDKGTPIVVCASRRGKKITALGFTNGTWFSMEGRVEQQDGKDVARWSFLHCEPYLRRTFKGTTDELKQIIRDGLAGKKDPPAPNEKEPPGFGPPLKKAQSLPLTGGLYAVIQLPAMGLIMALAALFPALFGGLALFMRRWLAALSTASLLSLLYFAYGWFGGRLVGTWFGTPAGLWVSLAAVAALGALWAGRRYRRAEAEGKADAMQPRRMDRVVLLSLTLLAVVALTYAAKSGDSLWASPWEEVLIAAAAVGAASFAALAAYSNHSFLNLCRLAGRSVLRKRAAADPAPHTPSRLNVSAEAVLLWALVFACVTAGALEAGRAGSRQGMLQFAAVDPSRPDGPSGAPRLNPEPLWSFQAKEEGQMPATPCFANETLYLAVFHQPSPSDQFGRVYALDAKTGKELWQFDDDGDMKPVFCSPVVAGNRLYIGEGFHQHNRCRMFCLDTDPNAPKRKLWEFATESHTESTPCVGEGKVVFGAGNDGIYCLDAETGKEAWHYTFEQGVHVDANPVIAGGRVYAGSGLSRTHQVNRIFCLDLQTGKEVWGERVEYSAYGAPAVHGGQVFFGIGNGNFSMDREPVAGVVLCRDAKTGERVWDRALPNSVVTKPAVDRQFVYIGCRDGDLYALDRATGEVRWKQALGGPVLASPALDVCSVCRASEVVYAGGEGGQFAALDPRTGNPFWAVHLGVLTRFPEINLTATPIVVREESPGRVKRRIFLATTLKQGFSNFARLSCFQDETDHGP